MAAIDDYKKYWDEWHCEWYNEITKNPEKIKKNWIIPIENDRSGIPIKLYFPEPYWGNLSKELSAVFLNINPGAGGPLQDISNKNMEESNPYKSYNKNNGSYSKTVAELSCFTDYRTTEWMLKWRINWLREILDDKNKPINVSDVLCADLIPWHTKKKSDIAVYAIKGKTPSNIYSNVISYISAIAQSDRVREEMRGKVIVRSSIILDILNAIHIKSNTIKVTDPENFVIIDNLKDENNNKKLLSKFNSFLTIFNIDGTSFYIFSGGSNSALPNPKFTVMSVGQTQSIRNTGICLKEFIRSS